MTRESKPSIGADSHWSRPLPCGTPSTTSTITTCRASSFSANRWAVVAPTFPAPTTVIFSTMSLYEFIDECEYETAAEYYSAATLNGSFHSRECGSSVLRGAFLARRSPARERPPRVPARAVPNAPHREIAGGVLELVPRMRRSPPCATRPRDDARYPPTCDNARNPPTCICNK